MWEVTEPASVEGYQRLARAELDRLAVARRPGVLVGGSGLYVRAALDDLHFPTTDPELRSRLEAELEDLGPAPLHARLATLDPAAAAAILVSNGRRIVRALEVVSLTGRPFAATLPTPRYAATACQVGLAVPRAALDERITQRVDRMWEQGLVEAVRTLER